jgi:hypothetical protein
MPSTMNPCAFRRLISRIASVVVLLLTLNVAVRPLLADCEDSPPTTVDEQLVDPNALNSSVGLEQCGRFLLSWQTTLYSSSGGRDVLVRRYSAAGAALDTNPAYLSLQGPLRGEHFSPSVALSRGGNARVAWYAKGCPGLGLSCYVPILLWSDFDFVAYDPNAYDAAAGNTDQYPSAAMADTANRAREPTGESGACRKRGLED